MPRTAVPPAQSAMHCHHLMAESMPSQSSSSGVPSSEPSLQASKDGGCCQDHCCCGASTSAWARPASNLISVLHLLIERARLAQISEAYSSDVLNRDSARAPPLS